MYKKFLFISLLALLVVAACEKEKAMAPDMPNDDDENPTLALCDSVSFTFTADVEPILKSNCSFVGCHGGTSRSGGVNLDGYNAVFDEADRPRFLGAIKHEPGFDRMPRGGGKLTDDEIQTIECWINQNKPE